MEKTGRTRASEIVLTQKPAVAPLALVALEGAKELGDKINYYLELWSRENGVNIPGGNGANCVFDNDLQVPGPRHDSHESGFLIMNECPRFASGDGKGLLKSSIRGYDVFIIVDVGNYNCKYKLFDKTNVMSPDDHFQDLKRIIQAASGKAYRINVIMPILYGGRQHRRNYRESLDGACALQELEHMGVENVITFDAHDGRVANAVPLMGFDNVIPSYQVLKTLFHNVRDLQIDKEHFAVISPDEGALNRNMYYASVLGVELGMFYKRRDYSQIVSGMNPIVAHEYLGNSVAGKDIFVCDDIIGSGGSMLDIAYALKKRNARRVFAYSTYAMFTHGLETFDKAHKDGIIDYVFGTNLTYRSEELKKRDWFIEVDVSKYIAYLIAALNHDVSTSKVIDPHYKIHTLMEKYGF